MQFHLSAALLQAGGGPLQTLVVVNDNDPISLETGQYFAHQRGIPDTHIVHLQIPTTPALFSTTFSNDVQQVIADHMLATGTGNQISSVVFTWRTPYQVRFAGNNVNGLSSAMYYGYRDAPNDPACNLNDDAKNNYWLSETSLAPNHPDGYLVTSMLTSDSLAQTRQLVDRSLAADFSQPSGHAYYVRTSDPGRNVRWPEFDEAMYAYRQLATGVTQHWADAPFITGASNVIAYLTGDQIIPEITNNHYAAGALADHMTSFGGLLNPVPSQMSIVEWIHAGCVGSYGTVIEPCAYTNKFPEAMTHYYYARGFSMGESYMMGLQHPYQGILIGDPLCRPFAHAIDVSVTGLQPGLTYSNTLPITCNASSTHADRWINRIDLYIDGQFFTTIEDLTPTPGNTVSATINGSTRTYTVLPGNDLADIAQGLRARINLFPNIQSTASALSDRVTLKQDAVATPGASITYSASSNQGVAADLTTHAFTPETNYIETTARAMQVLTLIGTVQTGDSLTAEITRTDGQMFTHSVTADAGDTRFTLLAALQSAINLDTNLQHSTGCEAVYFRNFNGSEYAEFHLRARTAGYTGSDLRVDYDVVGSQLDPTGYDGRFASNQDVMTARGMVFVATGKPVLTTPYTLDTALLADGPHTLSVVAYEGTAVATQGHTNLPFIVDNHDLDAALTFPESGRTFVQGDTLSAHAIGMPGGGTITSLVIYAEGKALPAGGIVSNATTAIIDTAGYAPGMLTLHAVAQDALGQRVRSTPVQIEILHDVDTDGLADAWELSNYGDIQLYAGQDDPDADNRNMLYEFITDTHPTNPASFFEFTIDLTNLTFFASTARWYQVEANTSALLSASAWMPLFPQAFSGAGSVTNIPHQADSSTEPIKRFRVQITRP